MIIHADNDVTDLSCHKRQKSPGTEVQEYQSLVVYICSSSWLFAVRSRDFFSSCKGSKSCQTWANLQNNNYFRSIGSKVVILIENSCHFLNLLSLGNSYTKSLVNMNSFYTNFTNTHFQKVPIPHLTRTMKQKFLH